MLLLHSRKLHSHQSTWKRSFHSKGSQAPLPRLSPRQALPNHFSWPLEQTDFYHQSMISKSRLDTCSEGHFCSLRESLEFVDRNDLNEDFFLVGRRARNWVKQLTDLWIPHETAVAQWYWIGDREAEENHIGSSVSKSPVFFMIAESIPKSKRNIHWIDDFPWALKDIFVDSILVDRENSWNVCW